MIEILRIIELASVASVVFATIYIMQHLLTKAHLLLRLGLALVCAGSVLEFYGSLSLTHANELSALTGVIENLGQAAVYIWAATSKRLWRVMRAIYKDGA